MWSRLSASTWGSAAALAALALIAGCEQDAEGAATETVAPPAAVETMLIVSQGGASDSIRASGLTAWKRETALSVGAPGEIATLTVDAGDQVRTGQLLATVRRTTVGADEAEAALVRQTAEQNFERVKRLYEDGAAAQVDLENARLALERTRELVQLVAPASGTVLRRNAEPGQIVSAGEPLLSLGETGSGVVVRVSVSAGEAARLAPGDSAQIVIRNRDPFTGDVARIAPQSVAGTGAFEVEILIEAPGDLRSGEVAEAVITSRVAGDGQDRFILPAIALTDARADQGVVYVVDDEGRARRRAVTTGGVNDLGVIVLSGLAPGDQVITRGASMVRDGDPVTVVSR